MLKNKIPKYYSGSNFPITITPTNVAPLFSNFDTDLLYSERFTPWLERVSKLLMQEFTSTPNKDLHQLGDEEMSAIQKVADNLLLPEIKNPYKEAADKAILELSNRNPNLLWINLEEEKTNTVSIDPNMGTVQAIGIGDESISSSTDPIVANQEELEEKARIEKGQSSPNLLKAMNVEGSGKYGNINMGIRFGTVALDAFNKLQDTSKYGSNSIVNNSTFNVGKLLVNTFGGKYGKAATAAFDTIGFLGKSKSKDFSSNKELMSSVGGSYGDVNAAVNDAENVANKRYSFWDFGKRHKANKTIDNATIMQNALLGIYTLKKDVEDSQTLVDPYTLNYLFRMQGGYNPMTVVAKEGGLLNLNLYYSFIDDAPKKFKQGGKVDSIEVIETDTTLKSVIPEGALHKNKHHLDKVGVDDSEITKKGIPVIDNQGNQLAEIELNEIIFTLEVTKELEKRYKEYYEKGTTTSRKNELALEAGKLLWKEILYNTDDRTGLIDTLKTGGTIQQKKLFTVTKNEVKKFKKGEKSKDNTSYSFIDNIIPSKYYCTFMKLNNEKLLSLLKEGGTVTFLGDDVKELLDSGDYHFITLDKEKIKKEVKDYITGKNGLYKTHNLIFDDSLNQYIYKVKAKKYEFGGITTYTPTIDVSREKAKETTEKKLQLWYEMLYPETSNNSELLDIEIKLNKEYSVPENEKSFPDPKEVSTKQIPTNLNLDGWDIEKTLEHLRSHAHDKSTHYCARYVRLALEAGGLKGFGVPNAKDEVKLNTLKSIGFVKVADALDSEYSPGYTPQAGDISITYENGNHAAMYDGTQWISDFRQKDIDVYKRRKGSKIAIYRRVGNKSYSPNNTIFINKSKRTLTVNGQTFKVSISKKGIGTSTKAGDNLTPEGTFTIGNKETKGGYQDAEFGWRPNAYGGKFFRIGGGSAEGRGFGIHGSDKYNDPDNYKEGVYGTHGCIAMKNEDLDKLEEIINLNGGASKFKVLIVKLKYGGSLNRIRNIAKTLNLT